MILVRCRPCGCELMFIPADVGQEVAYMNFVLIRETGQANQKYCSCGTTSSHT